MGAVVITQEDLDTLVDRALSGTEFANMVTTLTTQAMLGYSNVITQAIRARVTELVSETVDAALAERVKAAVEASLTKLVDEVLADPGKLVIEPPPKS